MPRLVASFCRKHLEACLWQPVVQIRDNAMPLLRGVKLRVLDDYVDLHSVPVSAGICNEYQSQTRPFNEFDDSTNPAGYIYQLPDSNYICGLTEAGSVASTIGKVQDFMQTTSCARFGGTPGFLWDSLNNDDLLMPGDNGEFSVSFWFLAEEFTSTPHDIVGKLIPSASKPRFLLTFLGGSSEVSFTVASSDGSATFEVKCLIVPGRWNLITARCYGKSRRIDINNSCEDGVFEYSDLATTGEPGCSSPGGPLYVGVNPDGASNPLSNGSFLLQQVCFWDRLITDAEERELYADGRGICRWPDPAVPYQFTGGLNGRYNKYGMTDSISHISPAVPGSGCENEPDCWSMAMTDYSPDSLTVSVSWTASPGGCIPSGSDFVLHRNNSQIIKGYRFGRTFESDLLSLPCGGSIRLFLESVPYHMSKFRYRQYLGVETVFGGMKSISKFAITLGVSIIKNPGEIGAFLFPNSFTSPSPSGANFTFPYSDSFSDYANDIVAAGWTDFATVVLSESITTGNVVIKSACIVANRYRFTVGSDDAGLRGGNCGWQMGISDVYRNNVPGIAPLASVDSRYNFRATTLIPAIANNAKVAASDSLLNRPFSAVARGMIAIHDEDGKLISATLPFTPDSFTAVIIPSEFVRPEPFSVIRTGGCIDCDVTASFYAEKRNPPLSGNPQTLVTSKILKRQFPQKTLSGAVSVMAMGAITGETDRAGLVRVLGQKSDGTSDPEYVDIIGYIPGGEFSSDIPITRHLYSGGTFRPSGEMQFTSIISQHGGVTSRVIADVIPDEKVNPNRDGSYLGKVVGTTSTSIGYAPAFDTASDIDGIAIDLGNQNALSSGDFPTDGVAIIESSNCHFEIKCREIDNLVKDIKKMDGSSIAPFPVTGSLPGSGNSILPGPSEEFFLSRSFEGGISLIIDASLNCGTSTSGSTIFGGTGLSPLESGSGCAGPYPTICNGYPIIQNNVSIGADATRGSVSITSATLEYDYLNEIYFSEIRYLVTYSEPRKYTVTASLTASVPVTTSITRTVANTMTKDYEVVYGAQYDYLARYELPAKDDICLGLSLGRSGSSVSLALVSNTLTGKRDLGTFPLSTTQTDVDNFVASLIPGLTGALGAATVSGTSFSLLLSGLDMFVCPTPADPSHSGIYSGGTVSVTGSFTTPSGPLPKDLVPPVIFDFSNSFVDLFTDNSPLPFGYPDSYSVEISGVSPGYDGTRLVTSESGTMLWIEESAATPYRLCVLNVGTGTLEFSEKDPGSDSGISAAARYRLAGFPDARWNINGKNQMQLVSADWSIGDWPIYITVEPV
jgi:hypothetical protein